MAEPPGCGTILAIGAHPDDIEFGVGGVIAREAAEGRTARFLVCSRGEAGTHGTPAERELEARRAAGLLSASLEFLDLGGDCHLEDSLAVRLALAAAIRRWRPGTVLAPTPVANQHPDHFRIGCAVREAARLARYGGLAELAPAAPHAIARLLFYAIGPEGEPPGEVPLLVDVSDPGVVAAWTAAMQAHATQARSRDYVELQLLRSRLAGARAGVAHAQALYASDPLLFPSLAALGPGARRF